MNARRTVRRASPIILFCLLTLLYGSFAHAQENWVYTYDGPGPNIDVELAKSIFYGFDGNIYASGFSSGGMVDWDFTVVSLTPAGDTNWLYLYDVGFMDWSFAVVQGSDENVYAAGFITDDFTFDEDFFVMSLDASSGDTNWTYRYDGSGASWDEAWAVAYGLDGNVYAAGFSTDIANLQDFFVMSLDPSSGDTNWTYQYDGTGHSNDAASHVVYGSDGNVYAVGYSVDSVNQQDFTVVSLDPATGNANWVYLYDGNGHSDDAASHVVFGTDGNVYAAGYTTDSINQQDFTVISLDPATGTTNWPPFVHNGSGNSHDAALSIAYGLDGNVYAAGYTTGSGTQQDFTVISLDPATGTTNWSPYVHSGPLEDRARSIVYGSNGGIYAAGYFNNGTDKDLAIVRLDTLGNEIWPYTYNGSGESDDEAWQIVYGSDGNVYAAGLSTQMGTEDDFTVLCLPANFPPEIPTLISPANAGFVNDTEVTFIWHASEDAETFVDGYVLQYAQDAAFTSPESVTTSDTSTTVTLIDTTYYWRVKAEDSEGSQSDWSVVWSFSFDFEAPYTPVLMSPIDDTILTDNSVTFSWSTVRFYNIQSEHQRGGGDGPPAPVRYVIQIDTAHSFPSPIIDDTFDVNTAHFDLTGDLMYYWQVKAFDLGGNESPYSDAESFAIDVSPPVIDSTTELPNTTSPGPFDVYTKVTDISVDKVLLWFQRIEDRPLWISREMDEATGDWYFEQIPEVNLELDTVYYFIYAIDMAERETYTDTFSFAVGEPGISEFEGTPLSFSFGLKNNPAKGKAMFTVALPEAALIRLRIYDASGRLIDELINAQWSAGYYDIPWASKVSSGVYFYSFESPWQNKSGKLVLVK